MNVALIPARAGSKGIKDKNKKLFNSKPLIYWTIKQAKESKYIDKVFVSSDDDFLINFAKKMKVEAPFKRPTKISGDTTSTEEVIIHFLNFLKNNHIDVQNIILLQPTSPLRRKNSIDKAFDLYNEKKADSLLSVFEGDNFFWKNKQNPQANYDFKKRPLRQNILEKDKYYIENGSIYIFNSKKFIESKNRLFGKIVLFEMEKWESIDIDDLDDWKLAESVQKIYKKR